MNIDHKDLPRYDGFMRLKKLTSRDVGTEILFQEDYTYDSASRLVNTKQLSAWGNADGERNYQYDEGGRLILAKYEDGVVESWKYDLLGRRSPASSVWEYTKAGGILNADGICECSS